MARTTAKRAKRTTAKRTTARGTTAKRTTAKRTTARGTTAKRTTAQSRTERAAKAKRVDAVAKSTANKIGYALVSIEGTIKRADQVLTEARARYAKNGNALPKELAALARKLADVRKVL